MRRIPIVAVSALCLSACAESNSRTAMGSSEAVDCRMPETQGSRLGPVCKTYSQWARYPSYGTDADRGFGPNPNNTSLDDQSVTGTQQR